MAPQSWVSAVDLQRRRIIVQNGKGRKDRMVYVSDDAYLTLYKYLQLRPKTKAKQIMAKTGPGSEADLGSSSVLETLTTREKEILGLLANGQANKEIAENLFISVDTVKTHLKKVYQKLEVSSRLQAVTKANTLGVVQKRKV